MRIRLLAWLAVAWCLGFAAVNVGYEATGRFSGSEYSEYATGIAVMGWLVFGLKLVGAVVALLTVTDRWEERISARMRTVLVWGAFALLGVYSVGSVAMAVGLAAGLTGSLDEITARGLGYVAFFLAGAAGYGILAWSFSRRSGTPRRYAVLGVAAAPLGLGALLVAIPAILAAVGLLPSA